MGLIERLKDIPKVLLLTTALSLPFIGCGTTTRTIGTEFTSPTKREKVEWTRQEKEKTKEFDIKVYTKNANKRDWHHLAKVTESLKEDFYKKEKIITENIYKEIAVKREEAKAFSFIGPALFGGLMGAGIGGLISEDEESIAPILGGVLGMGGGAVIAGAIYSSSSGISRTQTGRVKTKILDSEIKREHLNRKLIYNNKLAEHINVKLSGEGISRIYKTNSDGELNISNIIDSSNPNYFFKYYEGRELKERLEKIPLVQQMKPKTRNLLEDELLENLSATKIKINMETREKPSGNIDIIKNDSGRFRFGGYQLTNNAIYDIVRNFVDEEINSSIKSLTFEIKDTITHFPINGSNFNFQTNTPSKSELAGEYFTRGLKNYAERHILDYLRGNTRVEDSPDIVTFNVYSPSKISLEVTHPDYNYVSGDLSIRGRDLEKTVYMVDKGEKIRVEPEGDRRGRIE